MQYLKAFIAGFIATLVLHQGVLEVLHLVAGAPAPFNMTPRPPFGVPAVISLAFWGGVWGAVIWPLLRGRRGMAYWGTAVLVGAVAPTAVALMVVMPLKGMPIAGGWDPKLIVGGLLVNGAWGFGVALFMRWFGGR